MSSDDEVPGDYLSFYFLVFQSLLALVLILSSLLHKSKLASILPEAGLTLLVGLIGGIVIYYVGDKTQVTDGLLSFNPEVFFVFLLPPIIFNSGYHIQKTFFIRYFTPIALFACLGTALSTVVVAFTLHFAVQNGYTGTLKPTLAELFTFGGLISATDPVSTLAVFEAKKVDPQLFYIVFGESVLNDAVGVVLFNTLSQFVGPGNDFTTSAVLSFLGSFLVTFFGSMILGLVSGKVAAYVLKTVDLRHTPMLELGAFILVIYAPFFAAEVLPLSGIITALFTGITAKQYAEENLSPKSAEAAEIIFRVIAHMAETSLFLELGLSVFGLAFGNFYPGFVLFAIIGCVLGRFVNIYPITLSLNYCISRKERMTEQRSQERGEPLLPEQKFSGQKIYMKTAHMLWFSGLRGAVAYACAKTFPNVYGNRGPMVVTTMSIVLLTVFFLGGATEWALAKLDIDMNVDEKEILKNEKNESTESMIFLDRIDRKYMRPILIRDYNAPDDHSTAQTPLSSDIEDSLETNVDDDHSNLIMGVSRNDGGTMDRKPSIYDFGLLLH